VTLLNQRLLILFSAILLQVAQGMAQEVNSQPQLATELMPQMVVVQFMPPVSIASKATTGLQEFDRKASQYSVHLIERAYPFLDHVAPTPQTRRNLLALRRTYYVRYSGDASPMQVSTDLAGVSGVAYAEPVPIHRHEAAGAGSRIDPNDPHFGDQTYLRHLQLAAAWDIVKSESGSPRVVIAIVDGGASWHHEDLQPNIWINSNEVAGKRP